jgi:DNA-binding transcriptional LysR family regulator
LTLDQLRVFLEVAAKEHVTKAAQALNLTQSAVSASIGKLEAQHGVKLFNRVGRHIELTAAGKLFVPEARALIQRAQAAELLLADLAGAASGTLQVHASQTVASYWLPPRLVRFREIYPRVQVQLVIGNTSLVGDAVLSGVADLGVVEGSFQAENIEKERVAEDRLVLVVNPGHPWADGRSLSAGDLLASTWVMREIGSGTRAAFEAELTELGIDPAKLTVVLELPSNEATLAAVEAGLSACVVSERAAMPKLSQGRLSVVNFSLPPRQFTSMRHSERHPTRAVMALQDVLRQPGPEV